MRTQVTKLIKAIREIKLSRHLIQKIQFKFFKQKTCNSCSFPPSYFSPNGITISFTVVREPSLFMGKCTSSEGSGQGITSKYATQFSWLHPPGRQLKWSGSPAVAENVLGPSWLLVPEGSGGCCTVTEMKLKVMPQEVSYNLKSQML